MAIGALVAAGAYVVGSNYDEQKQKQKQATAQRQADLEARINALDRNANTPAERQQAAFAAARRQRGIADGARTASGTQLTGPLGTPGAPVAPAKTLIGL